ncbi:MAG: type 1 glutamine amidotransferase [Sphingobacteriales bacterium]|nr:MAG: type 1 glutamine amidotransferase [Sphingobacteriales bacterium]
MENLKNKRVAMLTEHGFEQSELTDPKKALEEAGATVHIISPQKGKVKAWDKTDWGIELVVDKTIDEVHAEEYDALVLPGGVMNPDKLRGNKKAVAFAREFMYNDKPVAAICHGPQTLIETGMLQGRTMTSYPSLHTDLKNAGASWVDKEVVVDGNLITSRKPDDIPAFNKAIIEALAGVAAS